MHSKQLVVFQNVRCIISPRKLANKEVKIYHLSETVTKAKELVDFCREKLERIEGDIKNIIDRGVY